MIKPIKGAGAGARPGPYTRSVPGAYSSGAGKGSSKGAQTFAKPVATAPDASAGGDDPDQGRMVYVGNVPFSVEWQELKDHMKQAGEVEFVQVLTKENGQSRGVGFVRYKTEEEAQQAIAMLNGSEMEGMEAGKTLEVDVWTGKKPMTRKGATGGGKGESMGKGFGKVGAGFSGTMLGGGGKGGKSGGKGGKGGGHDKSLKVWVGDLPEGTKWQDLKDHFNQAGTVEFCNTRGVSGEVRYASAEEAQAAIDLLNGSEFNGAAIVVDKWT